MTPPPAFGPTERDRMLREIIETRSYSNGRPSRITLTPDGDAVLFLKSRPNDRTQDLYTLDVAAGRTRVLTTADQLLGGRAEELTAQEKARRERQRITTLGITSYQLSKDGRRLLIPVSGKLYVVDRAVGGAARLLEGVEQATDAQFSPDGNYVSYVLEHDLHVFDLAAGRSQPVTVGGTEDVSHAEAEFVAQEEMSRSTGYWWSPDSALLAYQETDARQVETVYIPDPLTPYKPPTAWRYPRAGQNNAAVRLGLVPRGGGTTTWVEWDSQRYPYLAAVRWSEHAPLVILVQSRDQRDEALLSVDPATGRTAELLHERDDAWLNLNPSMPHWLRDGRSFLWISEADGERRLSLHDADGRRRRALNPDDSFRLRDVLHVDESRGEVIVSGSDRPTEQHVYALPLAGGSIRRLTGDPGQHSRVYARERPAYAAKFESLSASSEWRVFRADGTLAGALPSEAAAPRLLPRVELARVGPNDEFDASIVRPRNFSPLRRYPVIVSVYGGPSGGVVHAAWRGYALQQWYADQGFIVVSSDNRGVENRGRAWERAIRGNFGDLPLDDQVTALKALCEKYPELDPSRVGVTGWSFGGYMSVLAVAKRGDVFCAAAAGAPVIDWSLYDTHYTERYLGLPQENPEGYLKSSVLTYAADLRRPLLLIHGTADDNVYFGNSLRLADALVRAGKSFEFMPLPGYTHLVPDAEMRFLVESRIASFFRRRLLSQE